MIKSNILRKPISYKETITVTRNNDKLLIKGPLGNNTLNLVYFKGSIIHIDKDNRKIDISAEGPDNKAIAGCLYRTLCNHITGVEKMFSVKIHLNGIGYKYKAELFKNMRNFSDPIHKIKIINKKKYHNIYDPSDCFLLCMRLGFSDNKYMLVERDIVFSKDDTNSDNFFILKSVDKCKIGDYIARLSRIKKYHKYKGYGILRCDKKYKIKEIKKTS